MPFLSCHWKVPAGWRLLESRDLSSRGRPLVSRVCWVRVTFSSTTAHIRSEFCFKDRRSESISSIIRDIRRHTHFGSTATFKNHADLYRSPRKLKSFSWPRTDKQIPLRYTTVIFTDSSKQLINHRVATFSQASSHHQPWSSTSSSTKTRHVAQGGMSGEEAAPSPGRRQRCSRT